MLLLGFRRNEYVNNGRYSNDDYPFRYLYHHSINLHYFPIMEIKEGKATNLIVGDLILIKYDIDNAYKVTGIMKRMNKENFKIK